MAGTTVAFMICSIVYSLINLFTRTPCWSSEMFCRFTKCENDKIKIVYKYKIHDEVSGYKVSEHNEFYLRVVVAAADQQGDEYITTKQVFNDNCKNDNEICNYDGSEGELINDDSNSSSSSTEDDQTEEEIDTSPFVVNCPAEFESKKLNLPIKKYFYFVEVDGLKDIDNHGIRIDAKKSKKIPSSKKNPRFDWYGKDIKIRPCPNVYKKPWWARADPTKYE